MTRKTTNKTSLAIFSPLFTEILIGGLYCWLGLYIMEANMGKVPGSIGLIVIFWGIFKILLGIIIYLIILYSYLFRPKSFQDVEEKRSLQQVFTNVDVDLKFNEIDVAIQRLLGLMKTYPNHLEIKFKLANLYWRKKDFIRAGQYFYLKENPNEEELFCIQEFEKNNGYNSFQILRKINKASRINLAFVEESRRKIQTLIHQIQIDSEKSSWITKEYQYYLDLTPVPYYKRLWKKEKSVFIHLLILGTLYGCIILFKTYF